MLEVIVHFLFVFFLSFFLKEILGLQVTGISSAIAEVRVYKDSCSLKNCKDFM